MDDLPPIPEALRKRSRDALAAAARWLCRNQLWHAWPHWTADAGRFPGVANIADPADPPLLTTCWNTARSAQALLSAYKVLAEPIFLAAARRAMAYVASCQIFQPELARHRGACREESPLCDHIAARDTVEAVQGFVNLYAVAGDESALLRAREGADWFVRYSRGGSHIPMYIWFLEDDRIGGTDDFARFMFAAGALPLLQLDGLTGESRYAAYVPVTLEWVVSRAVGADGAMRLSDGTNVGHHAVQRGPLAGCFTNDDGVGVALLAAARATGQARFRDAAVRNGEWWLRMDRLPDTCASVPAGLNYLADLYRFTGDPRYLDKIQRYAEAVFGQQLVRPGDGRLDGAFRGQDWEGRRELERWPLAPDDYLSLRTTMYAMMALGKLAAGRDEEWNLAYSAFGWPVAGAGDTR